MFYRFGCFVAMLGARLWFSIRMENKEKVPSHGGVIVASNHRSYWDPVMLVVFIRHRFRFMAKEELFTKNKLFGWLIRHLGAFPVSRGKGDNSAIDRSIETIRDKHNLIIFPEGTRSRDGTLGRIKSGAALIAVKSGAPILPVAICYEPGLHFRSRVVIRYGDLIVPESRDGDEPDSGELRRISRELGSAIGGMLEKGVSTSCVS